VPAFRPAKRSAKNAFSKTNNEHARDIRTHRFTDECRCCRRMCHSFRPLLTIDSAPSAAKYACGFLALLEADASVPSETRSTDRQRACRRRVCDESSESRKVKSDQRLNVSLQFFNLYRKSSTDISARSKGRPTGSEEGGRIHRLSTWTLRELDRDVSTRSLYHGMLLMVLGFEDVIPSRIRYR